MLENAAIRPRRGTGRCAETEIEAAVHLVDAGLHDIVEHARLRAAILGRHAAGLMSCEVTSTSHRRRASCTPPPMLPTINRPFTTSERSSSTSTAIVVQHNRARRAALSENQAAREQEGRRPAHTTIVPPRQAHGAPEAGFTGSVGSVNPRLELPPAC